MKKKFTCIKRHSFNFTGELKHPEVTEISNLKGDIVIELKAVFSYSCHFFLFFRQAQVQYKTLEDLHRLF